MHTEPNSPRIYACASCKKYNCKLRFPAFPPEHTCNRNLRCKLCRSEMPQIPEPQAQPLIPGFHDVKPARVPLAPLSLAPGDKFLRGNDTTVWVRSNLSLCAMGSCYSPETHRVGMLLIDDRIYAADAPTNVQPLGSLARGRIFRFAVHTNSDGPQALIRGHDRGNAASYLCTWLTGPHAGMQTVCAATWLVIEMELNNG